MRMQLQPTFHLLDKKGAVMEFGRWEMSIRMLASKSLSHNVLYFFYNNRVKYNAIRPD